jgi:hypothetical protein
MRLSTISTTDGSADYQTVGLSPTNWYRPFSFPKTMHRTESPNFDARAWLALQKGAGSVPKVRTVEWYTWEITRLSKLNLMLEVLRDVRHHIPHTSSSFLTLFPQDPPSFDAKKGDQPAPAAAPDDDAAGGATDADITATKKAIKDYIAARLAYDKLAKAE